MSHDFDRVDAAENTAVEAALNRCRHLAAQIESELHSKSREHFVEKLSLPDLCASLEHAAGTLEAVGRLLTVSRPLETRLCS